MDDYKIRLRHTDSVNSVDKENFLDVQLQNTSKKLHFDDIKKTIDQYEQFQKERSECNRYRLILTINPFCSNVLFNPFTEMVKYSYDGNNKLKCEHIFSNETTVYGIDDIDNDMTPKRIQMIANTEYSRPLSNEDNSGYVYLPGYDMFDNHIIRNKSFKVVNPKSGSRYNKIYNTISDVIRKPNGETKQMYKRHGSLENRPELVDMHMYSESDILSFDESVNSNLYEENGWFGFINHSNLQTNNNDVEKVLNNRETCEFIDMYPGRELFSFNPTYNKFFDRLEYNWDIVLTYPYESYYDNDIVGMKQNGLKVMGVSYSTNTIGENVLMFRTYVKHNLKRNDNIILFAGMKVRTNEIVYIAINKEDDSMMLTQEEYEELDLTEREWYYRYVHCNTSDKLTETEYNSLNQEKQAMYKPISVHRKEQPKDNVSYFMFDSLFRIEHIGDNNGDNTDYIFYLSSDEIFDTKISTKEGDFGGFVKAFINELMLVYNVQQQTHYYEISDITAIQDLVFFNESISINDICDLLYRDKVQKFDEETARFLAYDVIKDISLRTLFIFRFCRIVNGERSKYYFRRFRKLPNLKKRKRDILPSDLESRDNFEMYLDENAVYHFDNEWYKLGFATTIYSDESTQLTYTDTIDVSNLKDNLGRPLSEIYATIIKKNVGTDIWYGSENLDESKLKKVEQSCCFTDVVSGIEISAMKNDNAAIQQERSYESDIRLLCNSDHEYVRALEHDDKGNPTYITQDNEYFMGDVVEFSPTEYKEYVLSDVNYRFNTHQRDYPVMMDCNEMPFIYHEIGEDDYDIVNGNSIDTFNVNMVATDPLMVSQKRDEGYYHKAHYQIKLHDFSEVYQDSHYGVNIREIIPVQSGKIYIRVKTTSPHKLRGGDILLLCDDTNGQEYEFICTEVSNSTTFLMLPSKPISDERNEWVYFKWVTSLNYKEPLTWLSVTEYLRDKSLMLRRKNHDIPDYAVKLDNNRYVWRNVLNIGDTNSTVPEYPYTNNAFYISKTIDFFLKRQDPDGSNGMYAKDTFPNDVFGKIHKRSNYEYKDKIIPVC